MIRKHIIGIAFFLSLYCFPFCSLAQSNYRLGIGLYEISEVSYGHGVGHRHPWSDAHQLLNSLLFEKWEKKTTHRVTARYIHMNHSLMNSDFQLHYTPEVGETKRTGFDVGYTYLYGFGKRKLFAIGTGLTYVHNRLKTPTFYREMADLRANTLSANVLFEFNIKLLDKWYISPSAQFFVPIYSKYENLSEVSKYNYELTPSLQITPIRISVKRDIS